MLAIGLLLNMSRQPAAAAEVETAFEDDPRPVRPAPGESLPRIRVPRVERRRHVPVQVTPIRARARARGGRGV
jgi:hypothetical protein